MFTQSVIEQIGYYVYYLVDPRTTNTFYVGKGTGNRVFHHVNASLETSIESDKISLINEIRNAGFHVQHYMIRHGLTEEQAFEVEAALIDYLGLENLTNEILGYSSYRGKMTTEEIISMYDAFEVEFTEPSILININKLYKRDISPDELYQATRCWWRLSRTRCNQAKFAFSIYKGIVREVYEISGWVRKEMEDGKTRWGFEGKVADETFRSQYIDGSIIKYIKIGAQNPIKYVNC
jgi:hypothetical protein